MTPVYMLFDFDMEKVKQESQLCGGEVSEVDKLKVATLCEMSWKKQGWDVVRIKLRGEYEDEWRGGNLEVVTGRFGWLNNWWQACADLAPGIFVTADIYNQGYKPHELPVNSVSFSFHKSFSCAALYLCKGDGEKIVQVVREWNNLSNPPVYTERMHNKYLNAGCRDYMSYAFCGPNWDTYPLIHFTRSGMQFA